MCKANQCVVCGAETPEGDHLCNVCKSIITEPKKDIPIDDFIEVRTAAAKIKEFCLTRIHKNKNGCRKCPIKDICYNEPYLWEV